MKTPLRELTSNLEKLVAKGNPIVRKNIIIFLIDFFAKSNLKNYFDKFFDMVKDLSTDDNTLVKYYTLDVISSIISKNSNKIYQQTSFDILISYLSLDYWKLNYGFIRNFKILGKLWINYRDEESLINEYIRFLKSDSKEVQLAALEHIRELVDIVEFSKCKKPIVDLLKGLIETDNRLKKVSIQKLFIFIYNEENEQQKQFLMNYIFNLLSNSDNDVRIYIMMQFGDLVKILPVDKVVKTIIYNINKNYDSFTFEDRLETIEVIKHLLGTDKILEDQEFYELVQSKILGDRYFKVRLNFIDAIFEIEDVIEKRILEKVILPLFSDFLTNMDNRLRTNVIMFIVERRFRLGEDKLSKIASTLIAMNIKDTHDFKWMSSQTLLDILDRTSRKNLKVI